MYQRGRQGHCITKIDINYHYVRTMVQEGQVKVVYCPTYHQAADILTKGTDKVTFLRHRSTLMGLPFRPWGGVSDMDVTMKGCRVLLATSEVNPVQETVDKQVKVTEIRDITRYRSAHVLYLHHSTSWLIVHPRNIQIYRYIRITTPGINIRD